MKQQQWRAEKHPVQEHIFPLVRFWGRRPRGQTTIQVVQKSIIYVILLILVAISLLPFFWLVSTSLKNNQQIGAIPPQWIPNPPQWSNYPKALTFVPVLLYIRNTVFIAVCRVIGVLISSTLVAYGFSRIRWPGRDVVFFIVLATMMLPYQVTMVPLYVLFAKLRWVGSYKPLIVPAFFGLPFFIFLLRQFFMTIPEELCDAARIDGCSEFGIFTRIILPLSKPALLTVALFETVWDWNDFIRPLIYINEMEKFTISLGLSLFSDQHHWQWGLLMAATTVSILPIVGFFFVAQRAFIEGITLTGMKG